MNGECESKIKTGLFSSTVCKMPTRYRCINCGKFVCEAHGEYFLIQKWQYEMTGYTCNHNCTKGLIGNVGTLQQVFIQADRTKLDAWGGIKVIGIRGQDIRPIRVNRAELASQEIDQCQHFISTVGLKSLEKYLHE